MEWIDFSAQTHSQAQEILTMGEICPKDTALENAIWETVNIKRDMFLLFFPSHFQRYLLVE